MGIAESIISTRGKFSCSGQTPDNSLPFLIKDIAVLELAEEVDLTVYTPICLPRSGVTEEGQLCIHLIYSEEIKITFCQARAVCMAGAPQAAPLLMTVSLSPLSLTSFRRLSSASVPPQRARPTLLRDPCWTASSVLWAPHPTFTV